MGVGAIFHGDGKGAAEPRRQIWEIERPGGEAASAFQASRETVAG